MSRHVLIVLTVGISFLLVLFQAGRTVAVGEESPTTIDLRTAWAGKVDECPECVLLELAEDGYRIAYFARPRPDCRLRPGHISEAFSDTEQRTVALELSKDGREYMRRCRPNEATADVEMMLVTIGDAVVGRALTHQDFEIVTIVAGHGFEQLLSLFPEPATGVR